VIAYRAGVLPCCRVAESTSGNPSLWTPFRADDLLKSMTHPLFIALLPFFGRPFSLLAYFGEVQHGNTE